MKHKFDFLDVNNIDGGWGILYENLGFWLAEIRKPKYDPLTKDEEIILIERGQNGDDAAREKVINSNLRFVTNMSRKYVNDKVDAWDVISAGNEGLVKAFDKFDTSKDVKLITYAVNLIRAEMIGVLRENTGIKLTNQAWQLLKDYTSVYSIEELKEKWPDRYTDSYEKIQQRLQDIYNATFVGNLNDTIAGTSEEIAQNIIDDSEEYDDIDGRIANAFINSDISDQAKTILAMNFGIDGPRMTLEEIAEELDMSLSAVFRVKKTALKMLASNKELRKIMNYE